MLAGNLSVTRRRGPPLALTTIEGCFFLFLFFFFQIHQIVLRHERFLVHFVWDDFQAWNACQGQFMTSFI